TQPRRTRTNTIEVREGLSAEGVTAAGVSVAGASVGGVSAGAAKRTRRKKGEGASGGALLSLGDLDNMLGQPEFDRRAKMTVKAEGGLDRVVGGGVSGGVASSRNKRNAIVRDAMKKHELSL
ncbi:MAG: hypothetical protein ACKPKO_37850, partial [Candidatus Fonsibacter sp.]